MNEENKTENFHSSFIALLEKEYGSFNPAKNSFEATSNSKIARDLCYSDSQFSRLINNTASEGEFKRALRNVNRLLKESRLERDQSLDLPEKKTSNRYVLISIIIFLLSMMVFLLFYSDNFSFKEKENSTATNSRYEMLKWSFENKYIKPYVKLKELPADCNYPCYKYQGKWTLKNEYKIPFFRERNGFHYVAKEAVMYVRCMDEQDNSGTSFEGYEYQKHEIWYDIREMPIDSFLVRGQTTTLRADYNTSDLEQDKNFIKIAYVHTFFKNEFKLDSTLIKRSGSVIGRDIEFLSDEILKQKTNSSTLIAELKNEVNSIAKNRLEDFSKPVNCKASPVPEEDFHSIETGDEMYFECQFSTGRFLVDYNKVFSLEEQYINNYCR
ncbi:hypothetical protein G3567_10555 [Psychroflexus sp. YR1-1]|uniref:Uncharacterized protein n=1 Tax=Psychroflexus aurantiacus TaxID=2709310 RepID=A0A6B3R1X2_9FLAO|nr:hypothetical protein [Psychroflexus aurantiacus]NEV94583.1 hypothetical protein [Psychroflexus aurantiacus]